MNPEQALQILIQCAAQAPLPNVAHDQWKQAYKVLSEAIKKPIQAVKPEEKSNAEQG